MERDTNSIRRSKPYEISTHTLTWSVTNSVQWRIYCICISTHTLTWSVTHYFFIVSPYIRISTHTLTWSVTIVLYIAEASRTNFNSHAHVERDYDLACDNINCLISTHTLTWSVTSLSVVRVAINCISTHTLTWSVTVCVPRQMQAFRHFNSHAHVERDELTLALEYSDSNFNSHAHVERDTGRLEIIYIW